MVRNRTLAGGGKPKKKGADTSKEAARAPCIQKQVVAESPFWLITGKHSTGRWGRLGDKRRRASSGAVQQNGQDRCASQVLCLLKQFPLKKMQTGTSLAIAGWGVKTSRPQCRGRGAPALVVKLNPACPAAKKKKGMEAIWGEITQESHFPPWHTFQYCCATLRSFEKIPQRVRGPWPQKWRPLLVTGQDGLTVGADPSRG